MGIILFGVLILPAFTGAVLGGGIGLTIALIRRRRAFLHAFFGVLAGELLGFLAAWVLNHRVIVDILNYAPGGRSVYEVLTSPAFAPVVILAVFVTVSVLVYLLPSFVAASRSHQKALAILMVNIVFGGVCVVWVLALVWAFNDVKPREPSSAAG